MAPADKYQWRDVITRRYTFLRKYFQNVSIAKTTKIFDQTFDDTRRSFKMRHQHLFLILNFKTYC